MLERTEPPSVENLTGARRAVEAMLLVANDPTPVQLLAQLVELPVDLVQAMCKELASEYEAEGRGFQLVEVAGGWRYQTHPDTHAYVERFALEGIPNRLSNAALETLAIVAYKQPISRAQIGAIRGVNVDGVLRTLVQRGYVDEKGRDDGPGQATLFGTTSFFLEQLGLMSLEDLPPLGDFVPSVEVLEALENTLRLDPEPEITIVDEDLVAENGQVENGQVENGQVENGQVENGQVEAVDGPSDSDVVDDAEPTVEADGDEEHDAPDDGAPDMAVDETDADVPPETNGASGEALNGHAAFPGTSNGTASNGNAVEPIEDAPDDDGVYEVVGNGFESVIPLDTHLAQSNGNGDGQADAELEPVLDVDDVIESESESELDTSVVEPTLRSQPMVDEPEPEPDPDPDPTVVDEPLLVAEPESELESESELATADEPEPAAVVETSTDDDPGSPTEPDGHSLPEEAPTDGLVAEDVPTDELEVAADPEVEMTNGTIATGAAGADDARFPGARSGPAPPPDPADDLAEGEDPGRRMGDWPPETSGRQDGRAAPPTWPETLTNGNGADPERGDA